VIEYAVAAARQLGHRYIGTEHLLLGMLQEGEGVGARVLTSFVTTSAIVDKVTEAVSKDPSEDPTLVARPRETVVKFEALARPGAIKLLSPELVGPLPLVAAMREAGNRQMYEAAVQEERSRLARDLHDSIKQQLFSISVSAAAAQERLTHDLAGAKLALADVQGSAQAAMVEMNALLHQLSPTPIAAAGLLAAIHEQCEALSYRTGAVVTSAFGDLPPPEQLPLGAQESIFRMVQEALANIARHARAQQVQVRLALVNEERTLRLEVRDDGQGFDPAMTAPGMGLANIQARSERLNGRAEISSAPGEGTLILVEIPLLTGQGGQHG
jgi:signal transduction histidine kinase